LVAHVPFDRESIQDDFDKIGKVLKDYNVKLGLCGHAHGYREFIWNGIPCVVGSSLSGSVWSVVRNVNDATYLNNADQGYLILSVSGDEIEWKHYPFTYNIEKYFYEKTGKRPGAVSKYWYSRNETKAN